LKNFSEFLETKFSMLEFAKIIIEIVIRKTKTKI